MKIFNSRYLGLAKKSLDVYSKQHESIAKNISNANDPGYRRVKTDFSDSLKTAHEQTLRTSNPRHIGAAEQPDRGDLEKDKKPVNVSQEMSELAVNQIRFDFVSRVLNRTYRKLNTSITGRPS
jgi:flagellar basal-body rod protein FlgB